jgi:hypothetical protein
MGRGRWPGLRAFSLGIHSFFIRLRHPCAHLLIGIIIFIKTLYEIFFFCLFFFARIDSAYFWCNRNQDFRNIYYFFIKNKKKKSYKKRSLLKIRIYYNFSIFLFNI